jgi:hypothetical protein
MEHGLFDWEKNPLLTLYCRIAIHTAADVSHCCIKTVTIHSSTINVTDTCISDLYVKSNCEPVLLPKLHQLINVAVFSSEI